jgi:hypothetical protein
MEGSTIDIWTNYDYIPFENHNGWPVVRYLRVFEVAFNIQHTAFD